MTIETDNTLIVDGRTWTVRAVDGTKGIAERAVLVQTDAPPRADDEEPAAPAREPRVLRLRFDARDAVEALYTTICRDRRHQQVYSMWEGPVQARSFDRWAMGFVSPDEATLRRRPGYEGVLSEGLVSAGRGSNGKRILLQLRDDFLHPA